MHRASPWLLSMSLASALVMLAGPSFGEESPAERHFYNALELMRVEDFSGAAAELEASLAAQPTANGYFNLANCYRALHRYGDSLQQLDSLEKQFADTMEEDLRQAILEMRESIAGLVAELTIVVNREGAAVQVDELAPVMSPLPGPVILEPGEHRVTVTLDGWQPETRDFVFAAGDRKTESFVLKQSATATLAVTTDVTGADVVVDGGLKGVTPLAEPIALAPGKHLVVVSHQGRSASKEVVLGPTDSLSVAIPLNAEPSPATPAEAGPAPSKPERRKLKPVAFIASAGTAVVFGGLALGMEFAAKSRWEAAQLDPMNEGHRTGGKAVQVVGYVSIGLASAGLIAAIVLATQTDFTRESPHATALRATPFVSPTGGGFSMEGRF